MTMVESGAFTTLLKIGEQPVVLSSDGGRITITSQDLRLERGKNFITHLCEGIRKSLREKELQVVVKPKGPTLSISGHDVAIALEPVTEILKSLVDTINSEKKLHHYIDDHIDDSLPIVKHTPEHFRVKSIDRHTPEKKPYLAGDQRKLTKEERMRFLRKKGDEGREV